MTVVDPNYEHDIKARTEVRSSDMLETTMVELALCCRDLLVSSPVDGSDLGDILIGHRFRAEMEKQGLCIVPLIPKPGMRAAWNQGWFRPFAERYRNMVAAVWAA